MKNSGTKRASSLFVTLAILALAACDQAPSETSGDSSASSPNPPAASDIGSVPEDAAAPQAAIGESVPAPPVPSDSDTAKPSDQVRPARPQPSGNTASLPPASAPSAEPRAAPEMDEHSGHDMADMPDHDMSQH